MAKGERFGACATGRGVPGVYRRVSHFAAVAAMALRPEARTRYVRTPMAVELVTGPPGSGKSTLVRERAGQRDALIDLDAIGDALSATGRKWPELTVAAWCARDAATLAFVESRVERLWIVACAPTRMERYQAAVPFASVRLTVLEVTPEECLRRIERCYRDAVEKRSRAVDWHALIDRWWSCYHRPGADEGWTAVEVAG